MKKVQYLIAAIFLLKQEKKRFYIVYSFELGEWVKKHKRAKFRERIFSILLLNTGIFLIRDIIS